MSSDVPLLIYDVSIQLINYKKALKSIDLSIGGEDIQAQWEDLEANNGASSTVPRFAHSFQEDLPPQAGYCGHQV